MLTQSGEQATPNQRVDTPLLGFSIRDRIRRHCHFRISLTGFQRLRNFEMLFRCRQNVYLGGAHHRYLYSWVFEYLAKESRN
jgi:hypothetical protein